MTYDRQIELMESEWSPGKEGFFWRIRHGKFDFAEFQRALQIIATLPIAEEALLPRRLVSLLWYIPLFMGWQSERVRENGGDTIAYANAVAAMTNEIERLLGTP